MTYAGTYDQLIGGTWQPERETVNELDGRGDVERIIAKLREPEPPPLRVKIRARGYVYFGPDFRLMQSRVGWDVTCSRCGKLDDLDVQWYMNVVKHIARPHLEDVHGVALGATR